MRGLKAIITALPGASAVLRSPAVESSRAALRRYGAVQGSMRFTCSELLGARGRPGVYTLNGSRLSFVLRHRTRDVEIFEEIFVGTPAYGPPPGVRERLRSKPLRVLDLGGNIGLFGVFALNEFRVASMTTFEPDPSNLPVLRRCRDSNPDRPWRVVEACAASRDGVVRFSGGKYADSHVAFNGAGSTLEVPAVDVFPYMADADLVKIDIEGSEWELLADARLAGTDDVVIVMEWHARNSPGSDPHRVATELLQDAGFTVDGIDHGYSHGMIWAWKSALGSASPS